MFFKQNQIQRIQILIWSVCRFKIDNLLVFWTL